MSDLFPMIVDLEDSGGIEDQYSTLEGALLTVGAYRRLLWPMSTLRLASFCKISCHYSILSASKTGCPQQTPPLLGLLIADTTPKFLFGPQIS